MKSIRLLLVTVVFFSIDLWLYKVTLAQECPYDSYAIIGNNCIDLNDLAGSSKRPTKRLQNRVQNGRELDFSSNTTNLALEDNTSCSEFNYQDEAQDYMLKRRAYQLDYDANGIACEHLIFRKYGYLSEEDWRVLKEENFYRNDPRSFGHENPLTLSEVQSILGFSGKSKQASGRTFKWIWIDIVNPKRQIEANFVDAQMTEFKGRGFKDKSHYR